MSWRPELVLLATIVVMSGLAQLGVDGWGEPWSGDTGRRMRASARYHCCCPHCPGTAGLRGCFPCRNHKYYCNCEQCSCFPEKPIDSTSFLQMLLRGGFSSSKFRRGVSQQTQDK